MADANRARAPHRSVLAATFEGAVGIVSAAALLAMDDDTWGGLRDRINFRLDEDRARPLARCLQCGGSVYIKVSTDGCTPLFAHNGDNPGDCPWYTGSTRRLDSARAAQYQGRQESELHRRLCEKLAELAAADPRLKVARVNQYYETDEGRGRYPDVYLEFDGVGSFTLEFQLSHTFATEVAARNRFYRRHGVGLLWVLWDIDPRRDELATAVKDVVRPHRGNLFRLDDRAIAESEAQKTLVLSCFTKKVDGSWRAPRLIRLDQLQIPEKGLPFFEDCRTRMLKEPGEEARARWLPVVKKAAPQNGGGFDNNGYISAYGALRAHLKDPLRTWRSDMRRHFGREVDRHIVDVLAILFSIAGTAKHGRRNYATLEGNPVAMLNSRLSNHDFQRYATLFEAMLVRTTAGHLLETPSLQRKIADAKTREPDQVVPGHAMWDAAAWIFPEAMNPLVRAELADSGELPDWVSEPPAGMSLEDGLPR